MSRMCCWKKKIDIPAHAHPLWYTPLFTVFDSFCCFSVKYFQWIPVVILLFFLLQNKRFLMHVFDTSFQMYPVCLPKIYWALPPIEEGRKQLKVQIYRIVRDYYSIVQLIISITNIAMHKICYISCWNRKQIADILRRKSIKCVT